MSEQIYTCSYCGEQWPESDMDLIDYVCGLCSNWPGHEADVARHKLNKAAHDVVRTFIDRRDLAHALYPLEDGTALRAVTLEINRALRVYEELLRELEKEEERVGRGGWRNDGE